MRVYLAGPMTGIPQFNYPAFIAMADRLRASDFDVVSPAELDDPDDRAAALASPDGRMLAYTEGTGKTWGDFLSRDVKLLSDNGIKAVVVLPGWQQSRGARLETFVANAMCGLPIYWVSYALDGSIRLRPVKSIDLYRAWTGERDLFLSATFGAAVPA